MFIKNVFVTNLLLPAVLLTTGPAWGDDVDPIASTSQVAAPRSFYAQTLVESPRADDGASRVSWPTSVASGAGNTTDQGTFSYTKYLSKVLQSLKNDFIHTFGYKVSINDATTIGDLNQSTHEEGGLALKDHPYLLVLKRIAVLMGEDGNTTRLNRTFSLEELRGHARVVLNLANPDSAVTGHIPHITLENYMEGSNKDRKKDINSCNVSIDKESRSSSSKIKRGIPKLLSSIDSCIPSSSCTEELATARQELDTRVAGPDTKNYSREVLEASELYVSELDKYVATSLTLGETEHKTVQKKTEGMKKLLQSLKESISNTFKAVTEKVPLEFQALQEKWKYIALENAAFVTGNSPDASSSKSSVLAHLKSICGKYTAQKVEKDFGSFIAVVLDKLSLHMSLFKIKDEPSNKELSTNQINILAKCANFALKKVGHAIETGGYKCRFTGNRVVTYPRDLPSPELSAVPPHAA